MLRRTIVRQTECRVERGPQGRRQIRGSRAHRPQQLVHTGEGQVGLRLHPTRSRWEAALPGRRYAPAR